MVVFRKIVFSVMIAIPLTAAPVFSQVFDGSTELKIGQSLNGIIYGAALADTIGENHGDQKLIWGVLLCPIGFTAGLLAPDRIRSRYGLSVPEARMINTGSIVGIGTGITLAELTKSKDFGPWVFLTDTLYTGGAAYYAFTKNTEITMGDSSLALSGAVWGTAMSILIYQQNSERTNKKFTFSLLAGQTAGFASGIYAAEKLNWSRERVIALDMCLLGGMLTGYGTASLFTKKHGIKYFAAAAGMLAGGAAGIFITKDMKGEPPAAAQNSGDRYISMRLFDYGF